MDDETSAAALLAQASQLRKSARQMASPPWFPLVVFGVITLASSPWFFVSGAAVAIYWAIAAPAGAAAVAVVEARREKHVGVRVNPLPYVGIGVALIASCFATGIWGGTTNNQLLSILGPAFSICIAYLLFAYLSLEMKLAVLAVGSACVIALAAIIIHNTSVLGATVAVVLGGGFLALGVALRVARER